MSNRDAGLTSLEDLYSFEHSLQVYYDSLVNSTNNAVRSMNIINESWDDRVQAAFMEKFMEALKGVQNMARLIEEHKHYVKRKADQLAEYTHS